jgi:thymidylate synthase (FAD)
MAHEDCKVELLETFGDDLTVVNAARVSFGKQVDEFTEKDERLIKYLVNHDHVSPFFHPQIRFRLKMPIWMAREWYRHTIGFARNEVSRRYVDDAPTFHFPKEIRMRVENKKQGSGGLHTDNEFILKDMEEQVQRTLQRYMNYIENGVPPEQARMILPQNMMTEFIETGSLAAYARLCKLRLGDDAQAEIREVAKQVSGLLETKFPVSWRYLMHSSSPSQS